MAEKAGCGMLHVQVMDGHFVPDISVGPPVVESLRKATPLKLSVELLVERPERFIGDMAKAGADCIAIHAEATPDLDRALEQTRAAQCQAGLALNPGTPIEAVAELLPKANYLVILTANAGLGEPKFIEGMQGKVSRADEERRRHGMSLEIVAAGGIGPVEADALTEAGADILVVGTAIFNRQDGGAMLGRLVQRAGRPGGLGHGARSGLD